MSATPTLPTPPAVSGGLPGLGHMLEFRGDCVSMLQRGVDEHGKLFRFDLGPWPVAVFVGPEMNEVFYKRTDHELDMVPPYQYLEAMFGKVAFTVGKESYEAERHVLSAPFKGGRMRAYMRVMQEEVGAWLDTRGDAGRFELVVSVQGLTQQIAAHCLMGRAFRDRMGDAFWLLYEDLLPVPGRGTWVVDAARLALLPAAGGPARVWALAEVGTGGEPSLLEDPAECAFLAGRAGLARLPADGAGAPSLLTVEGRPWGPRPSRCAPGATRSGSPCPTGCGAGAAAPSGRGSPGTPGVPRWGGSTSRRRAARCGRRPGRRCCSTTPWCIASTRGTASWRSPSTGTGRCGSPPGAAACTSSSPRASGWWAGRTACGPTTSTPSPRRAAGCAWAASRCG